MKITKAELRETVRNVIKESDGWRGSRRSRRKLDCDWDALRAGYIELQLQELGTKFFDAVEHQRAKLLEEVSNDLKKISAMIDDVIIVRNT